MRDRLIELIGKELLDYASWNTEMTLAGNYNMPSVEEVIADKILSDGWFRPPCKVGDKVYITSSLFPDNFGYSGVIETIVVGYFVGDYGGLTETLKLKCKNNNELFSCNFDSVGKTAFLTKEEAQQALKGGDAEWHRGNHYSPMQRTVLSI